MNEVLPEKIEIQEQAPTVVPPNVGCIHTDQIGEADCQCRSLQASTVDVRQLLSATLSVPSNSEASESLENLRKDRRVVIIDDIDAIRMLMDEMLDAAGYKKNTSYANTTEAKKVLMKLAKEGIAPYAIVTDRQMDTDDEGIEFIPWILQLYQSHNLPCPKIILNSGTFLPQDLKAYGNQELNISALAKPWTITEMLKLLDG